MDGFVFLNAETLTQDKDGVVKDCPAIVQTLAYHPILSSFRLIAVSCNDQLLPRAGERGFPHCSVWTEWNKRFQNDMWRFLVYNEAGLLSNVATRITGY